MYNMRHFLNRTRSLLVVKGRISHGKRVNLIEELFDAGLIDVLRKYLLEQHEKNEGLAVLPLNNSTTSRRSSMEGQTIRKCCFTSKQASPGYS